MNNYILDVMSNVEHLDHVYEKMLLAFKNAKKKKNAKRIGYVAGIIGSEGPEHVENNLKKLMDYTMTIRKKHDFPIFSATDVFKETGLLETLQEMKLSRNEREVLFITFGERFFLAGI